LQLQLSVEMFHLVTIALILGKVSGVAAAAPPDFRRRVQAEVLHHDGSTLERGRPRRVEHAFAVLPVESHSPYNITLGVFEHQNVARLESKRLAKASPPATAAGSPLHLGPL